MTEDAQKIDCIQENQETKQAVADRFSYMGEQVSSGGGCYESVVVRIRLSRAKFREFLPLLATEGLTLTGKGKLLDAWVKTAVQHGSGAEERHKLERNETSILAECAASVCILRDDCGSMVM